MVWYLQSPLGALLLEEDSGALTRLHFSAGAPAEFGPAPSPLLAEAARQLEEYFAGGRREFCLPLSAKGTPFQKEVWEGLCRIPYGETVSYGQLAAALGRPRAARAIGSACHRNPIAILVPCHRVLGAGGALTGYAGGLDKKRFLLDLEAKYRKMQFPRPTGQN